MIKDLKEELDNIYIQIKIHHERGDYRKAQDLFRKASELNKILISKNVK